MSWEFYFLLFLIYSFLGWVMEVIFCYFSTKKLANRGFLIGPICPIYGVGSLLIITLLKNYAKDPLVLFILAIIICSILEYLTSYILEKIFKVRWWDYSHKKYNLNGRICLETMIPFGLLGLLVVYFIHPLLTNIFMMLNKQLLHIIFYLSLLVFIGDFVISFKIISNIKIITSNIVKDNTDEIKNSVRKSLFEKIKIIKNNRKNIDKKIRKILSEQSYFTKRILDSFPKFKVSNLLNKKKKEDK